MQWSKPPRRLRSTNNLSLCHCPLLPNFQCYGYSKFPRGSCDCRYDHADFSASVYCSFLPATKQFPGRELQFASWVFSNCLNCPACPTVIAYSSSSKQCISAFCLLRSIWSSRSDHEDRILASRWSTVMYEDLPPANPFDKTTMQALRSWQVDLTHCGDPAWKSKIPFKERRIPASLRFDAQSLFWLHKKSLGKVFESSSFEFLYSLNSYQWSPRMRTLEKLAPMSA